MSTTSKSPRQMAKAAYAVALTTLPEYTHRFSPRKFTQPQLFVCLVLKIFFKTDYRGITALLQDWPELCETFAMTTVPHFTTLQKAAKRLLSSARTDQLLETTVATLCQDKTVALAALDSTGLETGHISRYFVQRKRATELETVENTLYRRFPKLAVVCDCFNHMILSLVTARGPVSISISSARRLNPLPKKSVLSIFWRMPDTTAKRIISMPEMSII